MPGTEVKRAPAGTQAIRRAALILNEVGRASPRGVRASDLLACLPIERPTLHRMLMCLLAEGLLGRDPRSKRFFLGRTTYELGCRAAPRFDLREICGPTLARIASQTGDTVFLVGLDGADGLVLDRRDGAAPPRAMPLTIGMRRPLGVGASGVAILMSLADEEAHRFVGENDPRLREHDVASGKLLDSLGKFRHRGYAVSRGYGHPGLCGVAIPLCGAPARPVGAISVTNANARMTAEHRREVLSVLRHELAQVGSRLRAGMA